ncbi:hypothetical protein [Pseudomonas sp. RT6P73]
MSLLPESTHALALPAASVATIETRPLVGGVVLQIGHNCCRRVAETG